MCPSYRVEFEKRNGGTTWEHWADNRVDSAIQINKNGIDAQTRNYIIKSGENWTIKKKN